MVKRSGIYNTEAVVCIRCLVKLKCSMQLLIVSELKHLFVELSGWCISPDRQTVTELIDSDSYDIARFFSRLSC